MRVLWKWRWWRVELWGFDERKGLGKSLRGNEERGWSWSGLRTFNYFLIGRDSYDYGTLLVCLVVLRFSLVLHLSIRANTNWLMKLHTGMLGLFLTDEWYECEMGLGLLWPFRGFWVKAIFGYRKMIKVTGWQVVENFLLKYSYFSK